MPVRAATSARACGWSSRTASSASSAAGSAHRILRSSWIACRRGHRRGRLMPRLESGSCARARLLVPASGKRCRAGRPRLGEADAGSAPASPRTERVRGVDHVSSPANSSSVITIERSIDPARSRSVAARWRSTDAYGWWDASWIIDRHEGHQESKTETQLMSGFVGTSVPTNAERWRSADLADHVVVGQARGEVDVPELRRSRSRGARRTAAPRRGPWPTPPSAPADRQRSMPASRRRCAQPVAPTSV